MPLAPTVSGPRSRRATVIMAAAAGSLAILGLFFPRLAPTSIPEYAAAAYRGLDLPSVRAAAARQSVSSASAATELGVEEFFIRVPGAVREPAQVLVVLHGMGGSGEDTSSGLRDLTDDLGWVVVAPTFQYGDWRDPGQVTAEAVRHGPRLAGILDQLQTLTGLELRSKVLLYGFSRGGQAANRFSLLYPERVAGVALASSGTYTLPLAGWLDDRTELRFPYGVADFRETFGRDFSQETFRRIPFWIGIGGWDDDPAVVPHQWDPYLGDHRLQRAERFAALLTSAGVRAKIQVFPGTGHEETAQTRRAAVQFLASLQ